MIVKQPSNGVTRWLIIVSSPLEIEASNVSAIERDRAANCYSQTEAQALPPEIQQDACTENPGFLVDKSLEEAALNP
jgi:hypothetical protein